MENQQTRSKGPGGQNDPGAGPPPSVQPPDTRVQRDTVTPDEDDLLWEELGATNVTEGPSDSSLSSANLDSPTQHTEISASRILGKNLVKLGDFQLIRKLGEGAMGAVYKAVQVSFKRTVALKVLFPHVAKIPKLVERLYREGRVMGKLDHPNIVQAFAVGEAEGCHYIAMEYVSGQSMQKWLTHVGKISIGDAIRVTLDCAQALAYAHGQNMVHRDIKPDNILLTRSGNVKVADLGMVKIDDEEMSLTQTGHAVGTPWYMPLEQARNAKEIDGRSDIYALGCTLYAMLTGHPPFMGRTIVDVIQAKELGTFPPARQANANVPERLDMIIAKMTAKLPKYRYQTCDELIKDLERLGLANPTLSFVKRKPLVERSETETPAPGKTMLTPADQVEGGVGPAEPEAPPVDLDAWYIQLHLSDGTIVAHKYTTAQVHKMLAEGTMKPTARASHNPNEGFRALATYKQFQGAALSKTTKDAADKTTAKYRGIYKKLEEEDRERARKAREAELGDTAVRANTRYWGGIAVVVVPIVLIAATAICLLTWLTR